MDALFSRLRELMDTLNREHPLILVEQLIASHRKYRAAYRNSKGAAFLTEGGAYRVEIMYSGHQGEQSSSFFSTSLTLDNLDRPLLECGSLARDVADVERQIHTQTLEGKFRGTVILSPSCLGEVLASAVENFAGDYAILNGTGLWKDKLGQPVASPCLTVSARPRDSRVVCGERFTGEGFPAQDRCVIEQGVLRDFDLSLYVANRTAAPGQLQPGQFGGGAGRPASGGDPGLRLPGDPGGAYLRRVPRGQRGVFHGGQEQLPGGKRQDRRGRQRDHD